MNKNIGLVIQTVLAVFTVAFAIISIFEQQLIIILQCLMALFMFVLAYNNQITFKRNKMYTYAYIIIGIFLIIAVIF